MKRTFLHITTVIFVTHINSGISSTEEGEPQRLAGSASGEAVKLAGSASGEAVKLAGSASGEAVKLAGSASGEAVKLAGSASDEAVKLAGSASGEAVHLAGSASGEAVQLAGSAGSASGEAVQLAGSASGEAVQLTGSASVKAEDSGQKLQGAVSSQESENKLQLLASASTERLDDKLAGENGEVDKSENLLVGSQPSEEEQKRYKQIGYDYYKIDSDESTREILSEKKPTNDETKQFINEIEAGDMTVLLGTNTHHAQPDSYPDFGRRFVLQYPYTDIVNKGQSDEDESHLKPKLASPELVLAVAKESALLENAKPVNPSEKLINKEFLRSGNYWNAFWKEDVDPAKMLRTVETKLKSVKAKVLPDTDIYELVAKLKQVSPKLLYVINKSSKN